MSATTAQIKQKQPKQNSPQSLAEAQQQIFTSKTGYFLINDEIEITGLNSQTHYNGLKGTVIGKPNMKKRYIVNIITENKTQKQLSIQPKNIKKSDAENHVYSRKDAKKKYGDKHGRSLDNDTSKVYFAGVIYPIQSELDILRVANETYMVMYHKLSIEDKRDIILRKKQIWLPEFSKEDKLLLDFIDTYTGSADVCDGCGKEPSDESEDEDVVYCPNCWYATCDTCAVSTSKGTCYCKDSNMGNAYDSDVSQRNWYQGGKVERWQRIKAWELRGDQREFELYWCGQRVYPDFM